MCANFHAVLFASSCVSAVTLCCVACTPHKLPGNKLPAGNYTTTVPQRVCDACVKKLEDMMISVETPTPTPKPSFQENEHRGQSGAWTTPKPSFVEMEVLSLQHNPPGWIVAPYSVPCCHVTPHLNSNHPTIPAPLCNHLTLLPVYRPSLPLILYLAPLFLARSGTMKPRMIAHTLISMSQPDDGKEERTSLVSDIDRMCETIESERGYSVWVPDCSPNAPMTHGPHVHIVEPCPSPSHRLLAVRISQPVFSFNLGGTLSVPHG